MVSNSVFGKTLWKNVPKHRDIKLVTTDKTRYYLLSEPNYHTAKFFTENVFVTDMKKSQILMNKLVHLGLSVLELSRTVMYEFYCDNVKPKHGEHCKTVLNGYK